MKKTIRLRPLELLGDMILVTPMNDELVIPRPPNYEGQILTIEIETDEIGMLKTDL